MQFRPRESFVSYQGERGEILVPLATVDAINAEARRERLTVTAESDARTARGAGFARNVTK